jgi:hypothetical protein
MRHYVKTSQESSPTEMERLSLLCSVGFPHHGLRLCPWCARYLKAFPFFHNPPSTFPKLSHERSIMPLNGFDRITQEFRYVIGRGAASRARRSTANVSRNLCGCAPSTPARRPILSVRSYNRGRVSGFPVAGFNRTRSRAPAPRRSRSISRANRSPYESAALYVSVFSS